MGHDTQIEFSSDDHSFFLPLPGTKRRIQSSHPQPLKYLENAGGVESGIFASFELFVSNTLTSSKHLNIRMENFGVEKACRWISTPFASHSQRDILTCSVEKQLLQRVRTRLQVLGSGLSGPVAA